MSSNEAIRFLESLQRQAEYRRSAKDADPLVAVEAAALELFIQQRKAALEKQPLSKRAAGV